MCVRVKERCKVAHVVPCDRRLSDRCFIARALTDSGRQVLYLAPPHPPVKPLTLPGVIRITTSGRPPFRMERHPRW